MIPAPISPQSIQPIHPTSEVGSSEAEDQIFSTGESEGEQLFEDMLALLSLLGTPSEAVAPDEVTESTTADEATVGFAEDVPATTLPTTAPLQNAIPQVVMTQPTAETENIVSPLVDEITAATSQLDVDYIPNVAEPQLGDVVAPVEEVVDAAITLPLESVTAEAAHDKTLDPQLAPTTLQQPVNNISKPVATEFDVEELTVDEDLLLEGLSEEELPDNKPVASLERGGEFPQFTSNTTSELPVEADVVSMLEQLGGEVVSSRETTVPSTPADTVSPSMDVSTVSRAADLTPNEIAEPIRVPIAEQVATHLTSARIVRGAGKQELTITLDPPRLGSISVEIVENGDGLAARVTAAEPIALQALQSNLSSLLDSLEQAGIEFDKFEFGQELHHQDQNNQQRFDDEHHHPIHGPFGYSNDTPMETETQPTIQSPSNKRLDITV